MGQTSAGRDSAFSGLQSIPGAVQVPGAVIGIIKRQREHLQVVGSDGATAWCQALSAKAIYFLTCLLCVT